jgi:hypothetical protein
MQRDDSILFIFIHNGTEQHARQGNTEHIGSTSEWKESVRIGFADISKKKMHSTKKGAGVGRRYINKDWEKSFHPEFSDSNAQRTFIHALLFK